MSIQVCSAQQNKVVTEEGNVYSYILSYRKSLPKLNYFINKKERIGEEVAKEDTLVREKIVSPEKELDPIDSIRREDLHFKKAAEYYLNLKPRTISRKNKEGLELSVEGFRYYGNEVFVVLELENRSGISLEVDYLRLFLVKGNNKRSGSYQKIQQKQVWSYYQPEVVYHGQSVRFVLAFSRFIPGDHEKILLELRERRGNRLLKMKLGQKAFKAEVH